jgi:hypothetical protein
MCTVPSGKDLPQSTKAEEGELLSQVHVHGIALVYDLKEFPV